MGKEKLPEREQTTIRLPKELLDRVQGHGNHRGIHDAANDRAELGG